MKKQQICILGSRQTLRRQFADDPKEFDRIKLFGPCMEAVKDKAVQKMELL